MTKSEVQRVLAEFGYSPNKSLGQNFLIDDTISRKIVDKAEVDNQAVLEIGPGLGSVTDHIIESVKLLTLVELDKGYASYLTHKYHSFKNVELLHADFLKIESIPDFNCAVSNLPYYCASEMIFKLMSYSPERITVMIQKEMAKRISAEPGSSVYGALSITTNIAYNVIDSFNVSKNAFYPRPDVDSTVIVMKKKDTELLDPMLYEDFRLLVKTLFWGRRKTILKCLVSSPHIKLSRDNAIDILTTANIDPVDRGENLSVENFLHLFTVMKSFLDNT
jgi:16S rRNA (adenine1518-N6/adenine1519-N6)-dimethyltransferase